MCNDWLKTMPKEEFVGKFDVGMLCRNYRVILTRGTTSSQYGTHPGTVNKSWYCFED